MQAAALRDAVTRLPGGTLRFEAPTFNEFVLQVPGRASETLAALRQHGIIGGLDLGRFYPELADCILMTATELTTVAQIERLAAALTEIWENAATRI